MHQFQQSHTKQDQEKVTFADGLCIKCIYPSIAEKHAAVCMISGGIFEL